MKTISIKLLMVAALCAFVGTGVVVAASKSGGKAKQTSDQSSESATPETPVTAQAIDLGDDEGSEEDPEATRPTSKPKKSVQPQIVELNSQEALTVIQLLQRVLGDDASEIQNALEADKRIQRVVRAKRVKVAKTLYEQYGVEQQQLLKLKFYKRCFVTQLQVKFKDNKEAITAAFAENSTLNYLQVKNVIDALTEIDEKHIPVWEKLAENWSYTYSWSYNTTGLFWRCIAWPFLNHKFAVATTLFAFGLGWLVGSPAQSSAPVK